MTGQRSSVDLRTERRAGLTVLRAEGTRLRATVVLTGRHRCVALVEGAIERLREVEQPKAICRIEERADGPEEPAEDRASRRARGTRGE